jgi:hypothetical protein
MKEKIVSVLIALVFGLQCFPSAVFAIDAPKDLVAKQESSVQSTMIGLSWKRVSGSAGYKIYDRNVFVQDVGNNNFCTLTGVSVGEHRYTVKAYDQNNNLSSIGNVVVVRVHPPVTIKKYSSEKSKVYLEWQLPTTVTPDGLTVEDIFIIRNGTSYRKLSADKRSFTDDQVAENVKYTYSIVIRWSDGFYSAPNEPVAVKVKGKAPTYNPAKSIISKLSWSSVSKLLPASIATSLNGLKSKKSSLNLNWGKASSLKLPLINVGSNLGLGNNLGLSSKRGLGSKQKLGSNLGKIGIKQLQFPKLEVNLFKAGNNNKLQGLGASSHGIEAIHLLGGA